MNLGTCVHGLMVKLEKHSLARESDLHGLVEGKSAMIFGEGVYVQGKRGK